MLTLSSVLWLVVDGPKCMTQLNTNINRCLLQGWEGNGGGRNQWAEAEGRGWWMVGFLKLEMAEGQQAGHRQAQTNMVLKHRGGKTPLTQWQHKENRSQTKA